MTKATRAEMARKAFAAVTGALEDATLVAADGQAAPDLTAARQSCDRLTNALEVCLEKLQRSRRQIG